MEKKLYITGMYIRYITEQVALDAIFYFEQVFVFCELISKNVLKWFLMYKEKTLNRSTNFISINYTTLCF